MFQEAAQSQSRSAPPQLGAGPGPGPKSKSLLTSSSFQQQQRQDRSMSMQIANDESPFSLVDSEDDERLPPGDEMGGDQPHLSGTLRASMDRKKLLKQLEHELEQKLSAQREQTSDDDPEDNTEPYLDPELQGDENEDADDVVLTRKLLNNPLRLRKPPPAARGRQPPQPRMPHSASNPDLGVGVGAGLQMQARQQHAENADPDESLDDDLRYVRDKHPGELVKLARTHIDSNEWYEILTSLPLSPAVAYLRNCQM